jgi:hypothetical protein
MGSQHRLLIIILAAGVGIAVVIGLAGARGSSGNAVGSQAGLCSSLSSLESAAGDLTSLDPSSASKSDYQSAVSTVQSDWDGVTSAAQGAASATMSTLDSAWDSFESAVKAVPSDASASDAITSVQSSGQALVSTTKSTLSGFGCS